MTLLELILLALALAAVKFAGTPVLLSLLAVIVLAIVLRIAKGERIP